jgi:DNA polymerase-1
MDDIIEQARTQEYVETILGRRRYLTQINSRNAMQRGFAERNAINAPIQGSAADIIKIAMVEIQAWLKAEKLETKMLLQVHDELVFDVPESELDFVKPKLIELMENAYHLEVPLKAEAGVGVHWLEAH